MKLISTLLFFTILSLTSQAQLWKMTAGYNLSLMQQDMKKNIPPAHSIHWGIACQLPGKWSRVTAGTELGFGIYASKTKEQTFNFGSSSAVVPVNYNSNVFTANLQLRYDLADDAKLVIPYINAKGGLYSFFSNVYIEDPNDPLGCKALQQENIISDKTFYWSAGAGLQVNTGFFAKTKEHKTILLDLGVNLVRGGTLDYINTKRLMDVQNSTPQSKPVSVQFVNASTQEIHEHTVAQVYTSPLRMLEIKAGVIFLFRK
jgi:hypothetical protein